MPVVCIVWVTSDTQTKYSSECISYKTFLSIIYHFWDLLRISQKEHSHKQPYREGFLVDFQPSLLFVISSFPRSYTSYDHIMSSSFLKWLKYTMVINVCGLTNTYMYVRMYVCMCVYIYIYIYIYIYVSLLILFGEFYINIDRYEFISSWSIVHFKMGNL